MNSRLKFEDTICIWVVDVKIKLDLGFNFELGCVSVLGIEGYDGFDGFFVRHLVNDLEIELFIVNVDVECLLE